MLSSIKRISACASTLAVMLALPAGAGAFTSFSAPLAGASDFATGFPTCASTPQDAGPAGMLFDGSSFFATDVCNGTTYRFAPSGGAVPGEASLVNGLNVGLARSGGRYYGVDSASGVGEFDPRTLDVIRTVWSSATGPFGLTGLATDPLTGDLYVSGSNGIWRIQNPGGTPTVTQFSTLVSDGLAFTDDGSRLYAWTSEGVVGFDRTGSIVMDVNTGHPGDGVAVARNGAVAGGVDVSANVFVNDNDGTIVRIDTNHGNAVSVVASGGSRGDLAEVGPDGCLYVTQTDRIEKLRPCFFQPTPPANVAGYVWADQPTNPSYVPGLGYQWNSDGMTNKVTRLGAGTYQVFFPGIGVPGGTVDVTGVSTTATCKAGFFGPFGTTGEVVTVYCFNPNNGPTDAQFTAAFTSVGARPRGRLAYLWDNSPTSASVTPSARYQYNSQGGLATVTRTGTGLYAVKIPGQALMAGTVKVTAQGKSPTECQVQHWEPSGSAEEVDVECFAVSGGPADSPFTLTFAANNNELGIGALHSAYVWSGSPSSSYSYSSSGGTITVTPTGTGQYTVTLAGQGAKGRGDVQLTAYGDPQATCTTPFWQEVGADEQVLVQCTAASGTATDSDFTLQWASN